MATNAADYMQAMRSIRRKVEENCDYVGNDFAEEARKIHYGEAGERNIYGEATVDEARGLKEEGIACERIPWVPEHDAWELNFFFFCADHIVYRHVVA